MKRRVEFVVSDPDEIWKPDYAGPDPVSDAVRPFTNVLEKPRSAPASGASRTADASTAAPVMSWPSPDERMPHVEDQRESARPRRGTALAVTLSIALVVGAGIVVMSDGDDEVEVAVLADEIRAVSEQPVAPEPSAAADVTGSLDGGRGGAPYAGADRRRLPQEISLRWSRPLAPEDPVVEDYDSVVHVVDAQAVVALHGPGGAQPIAESRLETFAADTGDLLWSTTLPARASSFGLVGVVGDVLLVESSLGDRRLAAYGLADGVERWVHAEPPGQFDVIGEASGFELVAGSPLVARLPVVDVAPTLLFDSATGSSVGQLDGVVIGDDGVGAWHVSLDGQVSTHDLSDGYSSGRPVARVGTPTARGDVVDGRIVQPDGGRIFITRAEARGATIAVVDGETFGVELPPSIQAVSAMVGSTMLIMGSGEIVGARLVGNVIRPVWRRDGAVQRLYPTGNGYLLLVASQGGAQQEVVDGRNGRTLLPLTLSPGLFDSFTVTGNGIVARRLSSLGARVAAHDLTGEEIWSLPGGAPLAVGDLVVARVEMGADGPALATYGQPATGD